MRKVVVDPDGTGQSYLGVIVQHATGVEYEQQCAGVECAMRTVEGYYVPLGGWKTDPDAGRVEWDELTNVFHRGVGPVGCPFGGAPWPSGSTNLRLPADRLEELRSAVAAIPYWGPEDGPENQRRTGLRLDETRLGELAEAWVPVITPDGPGILTWPNCD